MQVRTREIYCPAHFGNSYEVMGRGEMRAHLAELVHWGFTRYSDWFDTQNLSDPYVNTRHYDLAHALWDRKRAAFQSAQAVGLETSLVITPNHVFADQVTPDNAAVKDESHVFGQLVCPSKPGVRRLIRDNHTNLFADLARCGVRLRAIACCPYDYGGCLCEHCQPWIVTFAELMRDIHAAARVHHPEVEMHAIGWWWQPAEHDDFARWAEAEAPGAVASIALHIPYGEVAPAQVTMPAGTARRAFLHNGYSDLSETPRDVYGKWGPVIAGGRIPATLQGLVRSGADGYMAYSEGLYEDVNIALLGALSSGLATNATAAVAAYAERHFVVDAATAADWARWLLAFSRPFQADLAELRRTWRSLVAAARPSWRLEQWAGKLRLLELHARIGEGDDWPASRIALGDEWLAVTEHLQRHVWGLGPVRHIFSEKFLMPAWFDGYRRAAGLPGDTGDMVAEA